MEFASILSCCQFAENDRRQDDFSNVVSVADSEVAMSGGGSREDDVGLEKLTLGLQKSMSSTAKSVSSTASTNNGVIETEEVGWMNHMMEHLFPELAQVASFMFDNDFGPKMKAKIMSKSDKVKDVKFSQFQMGTVPPRFDKLQVTNLPGGICKVRLWGEYRSDMYFLVTLHTTLGDFQCGFKNLQISGDMVIICNPYEDANPGTASMSCYFVEVPNIDFEFAGTVAFINSLGIKDIFIKMAAAARRFLPTLDRVLVQQFKPEMKTASGILLPEATKQSLHQAKVVKVGPGRLAQDGQTKVPVMVKEGDTVIVGQCRPLSKTVRFNVLKVIPFGSKSGSKSFAEF